MQAIKSDIHRLSVESTWTGNRRFAAFSLYLYKEEVIHNDVIKDKRICFKYSNQQTW